MLSTATVGAIVTKFLLLLMQVNLRHVIYIRLMSRPIIFLFVSLHNTKTTRPDFTNFCTFPVAVALSSPDGIVVFDIILNNNQQ